MNNVNRLRPIIIIAIVLVIGAVVAFVVISGSQATQTTSNANATPVVIDNGADTPRLTFRLDAWADNWFAAYIDDVLLIEDSVPITTERSFNAETVTFEASYPINMNMILKDYKANDTGLEYIGQSNQQMGDGGFITQITELSSNTVVAVSNEAWVCLVIHQAPLYKTCEDSSSPVAGSPPCEFIALDEPAGWQSAGFDDSAWPAAQVYSANAVSPKDGYTTISWDAAAQLIWGPDLETDNTVLCRVTIEAPAQ